MRKRMTGKMKNIFWLLFSVGMPLLLLAGIEAGLRYAGYGVNLDDLFLSTSDGHYLYMNKDISKRYFTLSQATTGNPEFFKKEKDNRTFRMFVLGESAALGFPYPNNISFQRMLKYALRDANPQQDIEIVNLSLTAVNSYTFYDFGKELVRYRPDALLIYGGHNEYYGALGVGSTSTLGRHAPIVRCMIRLRQTRLVQWLEQTVDALQSPFAPPMDDNLMKYVVKEQLIPYQSPLFDRGIRQFEENMSDLLALLEKENIPVFWSTVATNLKDQYPFRSILTEGTDSADYHNRLQTAREHFLSGHVSRADSLLFLLHASDTAHAGCAYLWAQVKLALGDSMAAYTLFDEAKQKDCLRFRAPNEINDVVRRLVSTYKNVYPVETEQTFRQESPAGIPGHELLLEHVHPTIGGHLLIARSFLNTFRRTGFLQDRGLRIPADSMLNAFPVLAFDSLAGEYACARLRKGFPFYENVPDAGPLQTPVERLASQYVREKNWYDSMDKLYRYAVSAKDYSLALEVMRVRILDNGYDPAFYRTAGEVCVLLHRYSEALDYYGRAFALLPSFAVAQDIIGTALRNDQPEVALRYLDYATTHNTSSLDFHLLKKYCLELLQYKKQVAQSPSRELYRQIAALYLRMGNREAAALYSEKQISIR